MLEFNPYNRIAGYVAYNLPEQIRDTMGGHVHVRVYFNCLADFMEAEKVGGNSSVMALSAPGAGWAYPKYFSGVHSRKHPHPNVLIDTRSDEDMRQGCCFETLMYMNNGPDEGAD